MNTQKEKPYEPPLPKSRFSKAYYYTLIATGFLSRIPVQWAKLPKTPIGFDKTASYFPIAGVLIALPAILALIICHLIGLPILLTATIILSVQILTTGALHEDGLADLFDSFGAKTAERRIEIMRDSRIGAYGTLALIAGFAIKIMALDHLLSNETLLSVIGLWVSLAALSRALMVLLWSNLEPAANSGLSKDFGAPELEQGLLALFFAFIITLAAIDYSFLLHFIVLLIFCIFALIFYGKFLNRHIGGHTGDALGAFQQIIEISFLILLCV